MKRSVFSTNGIETNGPWTEEPGGLQSLGLQRVRDDLATQQQQQSYSGHDIEIYRLLSSAGKEHFETG